MLERPLPVATPAPDAAVSKKTTTLAAISASVTSARWRTFPPYIVRAVRTDLRPSLTHSGHWNPTDAGVMHSGQIGRSHREQVTPVSRLRCRGQGREGEAGGGVSVIASGPFGGRAQARSIVTLSIVTSLAGRSRPSVFSPAILSTTARLSASATSPKMVCLPVSQVVGATVMKNCDPLVPGPALAIASRYGLVKPSSGWISSLNR